MRTMCIEIGFRSDKCFRYFFAASNNDNYRHNLVGTTTPVSEILLLFMINCFQIWPKIPFWTMELGVKK